MDFSFQATIRLRSNGTSPASWHFISVPVAIAHTIAQISKSMPRKGRGSVKVQARIGFVTWETSIFPDKKRETYLLPIKADVRKQLHIKADDTIHINIQII